MSTPSGQTPTRSVPNPQLYSRRNIANYRRVVVHWSHSLAWKVDNERIYRLYAAHMAPVHLEVGPADGHFLLAADPPLDASGEPVSNRVRQIHLLDLNTEPLDHCVPLLQNRGVVSRHEHDVLDSPWPLPDASLGSIAMFHVLHCVPGQTIRDKQTVFAGAARALSDGGVFFGSTLLGLDDPSPLVHHNWLSHMLQKAYNKPARNIFHNHGDHLTDLKTALGWHFHEVDVSVMGSAAVWVAREPIR